MDSKILICKTKEVRVVLDLFGPMPSSNHVIVVHNLGSRYPAAKSVSSTKAEKVMSALKKIYSYYGNPEIQISDDEPPFNPKRMGLFKNENSIKLRKIAPQHPSLNPTEICMRHQGKSMKITHEQKLRKKETLDQLLNN